MTQPDAIVLARRKVGYGNVNTDLGPWPEGGTIPMRYDEARDREDCEPLDASGKVITEAAVARVLPPPAAPQARVVGKGPVVHAAPVKEK